MTEIKSSQKRGGLKHAIFILAAIVAIAVIGIFIFEKQNDSEKSDQTRMVKIACPENGLITTAGNGELSAKVNIPLGCGLEWGFNSELDRGLVDLKTFPDEKDHRAETLEPNKVISHAPAVAFSSREKPVTILLTFYPLKQKNN